MILNEKSKSHKINCLENSIQIPARMNLPVFLEYCGVFPYLSHY